MDRDKAERSQTGAAPSDDSLLGDQADSFLAEVARVSGPQPAIARRSLSTVAELARGRIQLGRCIGQGGMGVVYEAFDRDRGAKVALKTTSFLDGPAIYRLKREFRVLQEVLHPNLVRLYELSGDDGFWFFTMELVDGEWFDRWVRPAGELDEARLRAGLSQMVGAVHAIHSADKVHRDLKPSNVLVTPSGRVVVLDFGLTIDQEQTAHETASHGSGTPAYMAPEQTVGVSAIASSDLYAIGVMLFEALTGRLPFDGAADRVRTAKRTEVAPSVQSLSPTAPDDLSALADALLQRDPALRPSAQHVLQLLDASQLERTSSHPPSIRPAPASLLGRGSELDALRAAYQHTLDTGAAVAFVLGESGIGKTALVDAFLAELRAQGDAVVLQGRCYERELVPFKAFDSLIDDLSRHFRRLRAQEAALLMPRNVSALARLFPVLERLEVVAEAPKKQITEPQELRRHAFGAFTELIARMRDRRPLVIYIDDLHWLDADSALLLQHILGDESAEPCRVLLIASHRTEGLHANKLLTEVITTARTNARLLVRDLHLGPLDAGAVKELAQQLLGDADASSGLAERIADEAQGSPFFARELARRAAFLKQRLPTLQEALIAHVDQLPQPARDLLSVIATAGRPIREKVAADAARVDHTVLDRLRDEQLVRNTSGSAERIVECYHDRIRESVASSLSSEQARGCHYRLMEALLQHGDADPERLAVHCEGAGERARAAHYATLAADAAHAALAFDRAAELYEMAIACSTDDGAAKAALKSKLAQALSDGGRGAQAAPLFMEAADHTPAAEASELRRRAAEQWLVSGRLPQGLKAFRDVLEAVGLRLPASPTAATIDLLWFRFRLRLRGLEFKDRDEADIPPSELLRIDVCKTAWSLSFVNTLSAAAFQARHLVYALEAGEPHRIALGFGMEAIYRSMSGQESRKDVDMLQSKARALVERLDHPHANAFGHFADGQCHYLFGEWMSACASLELAEELLVGTCRNVGFELNSVRFFWANALVFRGSWRELGPRLDTWLKDARARGDLYATATLLLVRARSVTLATGDVAAVRRDIEEAMQLWHAPEFGVQVFLAYVSRLQIDLYEGLVDEALARLDELWAELSSSKMTRIQVCRVTAHQHAGYIALAIAARRPSESRWLSDALKHAAGLRAEKAAWAMGFALYIEGGVEQLRGQPERSAAKLRAALAAFEAVGMGCYAAATQRRLGALIGGEEGAQLIANADRAFEAEGVADPAKVAAMKAPGALVAVS